MIFKAVFLAFKLNAMIPYSYLDLAIISEGNSVSQTLQNSVTLAQLAENNDFTRYWFAEHHNTPSIASSATALLIGKIAENTSTIRVGSGGIMLPNHSPLVIAEQFGTLYHLYPNRIDLGLGRAPGTDQLTAQALNPNFFENVRNFPENVEKLQFYFSDENTTAVKAFPGQGTHVPIWILGSSTDSAFLASSKGLPYAFASHFAPNLLPQAFDIYQSNFVNSGQKSHKMATVNVILAETDAHAQYIATTMYQMFLGLFRNTRGLLPSPIKTMEGFWSEGEMNHILQMTRCSFIGSKETVKGQISSFINQFDLDEIMITSPLFYLEDKMFSLHAFAEIMKELDEK